MRRLQPDRRRIRADHDALNFVPSTPLTLANVSALFRYGWLAHTLGLSVLEFLLLREFTGLDPFAPLDPGTPPARPNHR